MSDDESAESDTEPAATEALTVDADSIAASSAPAGRESVPCPRCDTPIALLVSYGPTTHEARPCGCRVSRGREIGPSDGSRVRDGIVFSVGEPFQRVTVQRDRSVRL